MKEQLKIGFSVLALLILGGCASTPADFARTPEVELCMKYLTFPSTNIHQSSRAAAIAQRGIDCSKYAGAAGARIRADQGLENVLRGLANQPGSSGTGSGSRGQTCISTRESVQGLNKICFYDCTGSGHAITIRSTQLCPLRVTK